MSTTYAVGVVVPKAEQRAQMRSWRRGITDADLATRSGRVARHIAPLLQGHRAVMGFRAVRGEPVLDTVWNAMINAGGDVVWATADDDPTEVSLDGVTAVVMPALAVTAAGDRLGQGGGWYDRLLQRCAPSVRTIAVCFDEQVVDALDVEAHDMTVDIIITDLRVLEPPSRDAAAFTGRRSTRGPDG